MTATWGVVFKVLVAEKASAHERHAQQVEVFGRNDGTIDHRSLIVHRLDAFADQWQPGWDWLWPRGRAASSPTAASSTPGRVRLRRRISRSKTDSCVAVW